jgi:hypothetical protein
MAGLMTVVIGLVSALIILRLREGGLHRGSRGRLLSASLDDLVELPSVEPNAAALGAIIDLDALPLAHHERDATDGAWHTGGAGHRLAS